MVNWELILLLTGLMLFAYWLNFVMGGPLSDDPDKIDIKAMLFFIPWELAKRRLKDWHLWNDLQHDMRNELNMTKENRTKYLLKQDKKKDIFLVGRDFFTWERFLLCPVCFHWWLTVIVGFLLLCADGLNARADFYVAAFTYLVNHLIIRKIS